MALAIICNECDQIIVVTSETQQDWTAELLRQEADRVFYASVIDGRDICHECLPKEDAQEGDD